MFITVFNHTWSNEKLQRFDYLCRAIFEVDQEVIKLNLDSDDPIVKEFREMLSSEEFESIKRQQCQTIRRLRQEAYKELSDPLYMAHIADGDAIDLFNAAREAVKKMYPWPGDYR